MQERGELEQIGLMKFGMTGSLDSKLYWLFPVPLAGSFLTGTTKFGVSNSPVNLFYAQPVIECALPSLSALLENARINDTDSFVICIQIHSPVGPSLPAQPSVYYVPKDLLDGLEASLDNPRT